MSSYCYSQEEEILFHKRELTNKERLVADAKKAKTLGVSYGQYQAGIRKPKEDTQDGYKVIGRKYISIQ